MRPRNDPVRPRNDPAQYDDLADEWQPPRGQFAALHWLAAARGALLPPPDRSGAVLLDLGCGAGLLAPHVPAGYRHVGVDLSPTASALAAQQGIEVVRGDLGRLPIRDETADVVVAGEVLEHVADLHGAVGEIARTLRTGGRLVCDTINDTLFARLAFVAIGERLPGGPPPRVHDPALFVSPARLASVCSEHRIEVTFRGLRPSPAGYLRWLLRRTETVPMVPIRSTAGLYQAVGVKRRPMET